MKIMDPQNLKNAFNKHFSSFIFEYVVDRFDANLDKKLSEQEFLERSDYFKKFIF
jgi:hypothetical protein